MTSTTNTTTTTTTTATVTVTTTTVAATTLAVTTSTTPGDDFGPGPRANETTTPAPTPKDAWKLVLSLTTTEVITTLSAVEKIELIQQVKAFVVGTSPLVESDIVKVLVAFGAGATGGRVRRKGTMLQLEVILNASVNAKQAVRKPQVVPPPLVFKMAPPFVI